VQRYRSRRFTLPKRRVVSYSRNGTRARARVCPCVCVCVRAYAGGNYGFIVFSPVAAVRTEGSAL